MSNLVENEEKTISEILFLLGNPQEFKKRLKENFFSIESDSTLKSAIQVLQLDCYLGSHEEIKKAKSALKSIGLSAAIPEEAQVKRTKYRYLKYFEANIEHFHQVVEGYKTIADKALERTKDYTKSWQASEREDALADILKVPVEIFSPLEGHAPLDIAFALIGHRFGIKPSSVKDLYFKPKPIRKSPIGLITWISENGPLKWVNNKGETVEFISFVPAKDLGFTQELMKIYWKIRRT